MFSASSFSLSPAFSGHQTFVFRYPWLKKGVDAIARDAGVFRASDAIVRLGVGKNMVDAIRHWTLATGVVEEAEPESGSRVKSLRVSELGTRMLTAGGFDPFLEDDASLWVLHWHLATNPNRATTWYAAFNLWQSGDFTRESLAAALKRWAETNGFSRLSESSLAADVSCFVRTYLPGRRGTTSSAEETLDCPLASLGLLTGVAGPAEPGKKRNTIYRFQNKPKPGLPPAVFAYALCDFWNRLHAAQETLSLREIVHGEASPGRVFRLSEDSVMAYLDALPLLTRGDLFFADTALVRQVARRRTVVPLSPFWKDTTPMRPTLNPPLPPTLADVLTVRRRFLRSVHLERDFYAPGSDTGYVPTPAAASALERITRGLTKPAERAFSLTGAYGSGKSAFAVMLAKTLCAAPWGTATEHGLFPVLIVGGREPVGAALVAGVTRAVRAAGVRVTLPDVPDDPTGAEVTRYFEAVSATLSASLPGVTGLLVVADEAGKYLEHAALHPESGDLQALQEMAEAAVRSPRDAPLFFISVFHQAFDEYANRLGAKERGEWRKVQGRFTDLAFADAPEETLRLVGRAMERVPDPARDAAIRVYAENAAGLCASLSLLPRTISETEFASLVDATYPLHPLTLLTLSAVFRRFGQGERSLFGFLAGDEPGGLRYFLAEVPMDEIGSALRTPTPEYPGVGVRETKREPNLYTLDRLYDYLLATVGAGALIGAAGSGSAVARLWSETQEAVERAGQVASLPVLAATVAKVIGLLHVLDSGAASVPASGAVLRFAVAASEDEVTATIAALEQATLVTFRRFKNAYKPYEGSDVDVEELLRAARVASAGIASDVTQTAAKLSGLGAGTGDEAESAPMALLPVVARRHLFETGTLRLFEQVLTRPERLSELPPRSPDDDTDGTILLCLARDNSEAVTAGQTACVLFADRPDVIVQVLPESDALRETALAVELLLAVQAAHGEIERDRVASREMRERFAEAQAAFESAWERLLSGALPEVGTAREATTRWYYRGQQVNRRGARARQHLVSEAADATYFRTPRLPNELVNRRQLTSVAASARRTLLEAMIERGAVGHLGIEGFPPERSMYASLLWETRIHRQAEDGDGDWEFGAPDPERDPALFAVWEAMESFLFDTNAEMSARPLTDLFATLRLPPFGLSEGILPVLLCASLMYYADEVLLYEDGIFLTALDAATLERLARRPEFIQVQGIRVRGERARVLERLAAGLLKPGEPVTVGTVTRALFRRVQRLPVYALRTKSITPESRAVRDLLQEARAPERLLFVELPSAVGAQPLTDRNEGDEANRDRFFHGLNVALQDWFGAYPRLLDRLSDTLARSFQVADRAELQERLGKIRDVVREPRLLAFAQRVGDDAESEAKWIESVAAVVCGRPPSGWVDGDEAKFADNLTTLVTAFQSAESVAVTKARIDGSDTRIGMRFSYTEETGREHARVMFLSKQNEQRVAFLTDQLWDEIAGLIGNKTQDMQLAAIGRVAQQIIRSSPE